MHKRDKIIKYARQMINTPFVHQGRVPHVGLDCAGLVVCACMQSGINVTDQTGYSQIPDGSFVVAVENHCDRVEFKDTQPGDFMMFKWLEEPQHIAIVTQVAPIHIIHTWNAVGKVVENGLDEYWLKRLTACYRIKGLD